MKVLLLMSSIPGAKGHGISSSSVLEHIIGGVSAITMIVFSEKPQKQSDTQHHSDDEEMNNNDDDEEESALSGDEVDKKLFLSISDTFIKFAHLFSGSGDQSLYETYIEALVQLLCLGSCKSEFALIKSIATDALVLEMKDMELGGLTVYKYLLPILSMNYRVVKTSQNNKFSTACHRVVVKIISLILNELTVDPPQISPLVLNRSEEHNIDESTEIDIDIDSGSPIAVIIPVVAQEAPLPLQLAALVGVLQRVLLTSPDKAPIRAMIAGSIGTIIASLANCHVNINGYTRQCRANALNRYMGFITSMARSQKISRRAFSIEVAAELLRLPNVWTLAQGANDLLNAVVGRCGDIAPTVRSRALLAFSDLLDDLGNVMLEHPSSTAAAPKETPQYSECPIELCRSLYNLVIGRSNERAFDLEGENFTVEKKQNVMDTLKLLTCDEKSTSRVKALKAYSTALSIKWPNVKQSGESSAETVSMLVSDDDIAIFVRACSDPNVSVRKQAVDSLTDLLWSRPVDASIQDVWVLSVLPLLMDGEQSVQQKVALSVYAVIFDTSVKWKDALTKQSELSPALLSLCWRLTSKLADAGLVRMLSAAVSILVKNGVLDITTSTSGAISIKKLISVVESACI